MTNKNKNKKGFTLIELLVVVTIIGALAAVGVVAYIGYIGAAPEVGKAATHEAQARRRRRTRGPRAKGRARRLAGRLCGGMADE